jgi:hypothetical protein
MSGAIRQALASEQRAEDRHGLIEPLPTVVERDAERVVVALRRARPDAGCQSPA